MDRHLFDILWEVYRDVDGKQPIQIISSYRSPATNAMLRRRSSGVARHSQHMLGHAMDFFIPGVPLEQIRFAGLRLQRGGVGFYPTSGSPFVHLDTGSIRHWPRMTHDQLARVFPDGRTVHVPSDGVPLKGYELALADIEKRGNGDDAATVEQEPSLLAALFRAASRTTRKTRPPALRVEREARTGQRQRPPKSADPVPMPRAKPRRRGPPAGLGRRPDRVRAQSRSPQRIRPRKLPPTRLSRSRRRRPTSSMPAASGTTMPRREAGDRGAGRRASAPARRSPAPPIRRRPPASPKPSTRRWPMRRPPLRRSTAPTSSPPARRSRAAARPARNAAPPRPRSTPSSPRARRARQRGRDLDPDRRRQRQRSPGCASMMLAPSATTRCRRP